MQICMFTNLPNNQSFSSMAWRTLCDPGRMAGQKAKRQKYAWNILYHVYGVREKKL